MTTLFKTTAFSALLIGLVLVAMLGYLMIWRNGGLFSLKLEAKDIISIAINTILLLIGLFTLILMMQQIQQGFKLADEDREIQRLAKVQDEIALLRAMDAEIGNNKKLFDKLLSEKDKFKDGENIHFINYSTNALPVNITRNTLRFDIDLLRRLFDLYDFFQMSNNIFEETRNPRASKVIRKNHFAQLLHDSEQNLVFYMTVINDLSRYINFYEGFSNLQTKKTLEEGTTLIAYPENNQLVVNNFGGETAHHISIELVFINLLHPPLFDPMNGEQALASQLSMKYPLPIPMNPISEITAKGSLKYTSKHSKNLKEEKFTLKWDDINKKWILLSTSSPKIKIENGKISTEIGQVPY